MKKRMTALALMAALLVGTALPVFANEDATQATALDLAFDWIVAIWEAFNPTIVPTGQPEAPETVLVVPEPPTPQWQAMNPTIVPTGEPVNAEPPTPENLEPSSTAEASP